jgi:hypothetical protein
MPFVVTLPTLRCLWQTLVVKPRLSVNAAPIAAISILPAIRSKHAAGPFYVTALSIHDHFESI